MKKIQLGLRISNLSWMGNENRGSNIFLLYGNRFDCVLFDRNDLRKKILFYNFYSEIIVSSQEVEKTIKKSSRYPSSFS